MDDEIISRESLLLWMEALESYARDWDVTFENRPSYFTQEFWYLLVGCMISNWQGRPLTVSALCHRMKSGSNRTREDRIKKAVADGYLTKDKSGADGRTTIVRPTEKLEQIMREHFRRTYISARDALLAK